MPFAGWCRGDCDGDRTVAVNELIDLVAIGLEQRPASTCPGGDGNGDGTVSVAEILGGVGAALHGCPRGADMLLCNGKVFTANPDQPSADAVAIQAGVITAVGSADVLRGLADAHTEILDLGGRTVIPGFNDAHVHVLPFFPFPTFFVGLDPSLDEATAALAPLAAAAPEGGTIGGSIGATVLDDPTATRFLLDGIAPQNPVVMQGFTGHGMLFNTALMDRLGVAADQPDPPGGFFVRDPDTGIISGVAHEYAQFIMERQYIAQQSEAAAIAVYRIMDQVFASQGITSVQLMAGQPTLQLARLLAAADPKLRWRIIRMPMPTDADWPLDDVDGHEAFSHPHVMISGLKYFLDGTPIERLAALRIPYADRPESSGHLNFSAADIEQMLRSAIDADQQPMFHAVGDRAIETLLTAMEAVAPPATWQRLRPRVEHGDVLPPDLFERARAVGLVVVQNPIHFTLTDEFGLRFDAERLAQNQPMQTLLREGIPLALGSDSPATPLDDIQLAIAHPANPAEGLTREQALLAHTSGAAYAEHAEQYKGRLAPCMLADITVLSLDILTVPLAEVPNAKPLLTMVGGEIVYRDPTL
ncbi:MAG: amidohydrolase [Candidatus Binatia bacterium]